MKKPTYRKTMKPGLGPTESTEQCALMVYAESMARRVPAWGNLFAIPNGGARHLFTAVRMRREGVKRGVPDLFLAWPAGGRPGLFLELKRSSGGKVSAAQADWHERLGRAGYAVAVAAGYNEAVAVITRYLAGTFDTHEH